VAVGQGALQSSTPRARRRGAPRAALSTVGGLLVLVLALGAGFGWMYALRALGALAVGPGQSDALPLLQLAGAANQPLLRVLVAWASVGLVAGVALVGLSRPRRLLIALATALVLLALGSQAAFAIAHTLNFTHVLVSRWPGSGMLVEAIAFAVAAAVPRLARRSTAGSGFSRA